jgi:hypothetical protein
LPGFAGYRGGVRNSRFTTWLTGLVDDNLPDDITRLDWDDTGINADPGMGTQCTGLVFQAPDGGTAYLRIVQAGGPLGDNPDNPEREPVIGTPPPPVAPVGLQTVDGHLRMADLEAWLTALILNEQHPEVADVQRYSVREVDPRRATHHPFGFSVTWHDGDTAVVFLQYTLTAGERRSDSTQYRIKELV